jgi:hypothetical protein
MSMQMKVDPRVERVVDRADKPPVDMCADAEPPDLAIGGQAEPVAEVVVIAIADQRIAQPELRFTLWPARRPGLR